MEETDKPVWVWTPESTEPMRAGTFSLKSGVRTTGVFSYSKEYIEASDAFALDPVHLPFSSRLTARSRHKDGLFGCLRDACPEGYGRDMLIHRYGLQSNPDPLTLLEVSPGDGVGTIEVCENIQQKMDFRAPVAQRLLELMADLPPERHSSKAVHQLLDVGTSVGGERPKTTVQHDGALWLAKLQDRGDAPHMPAREFAAMQLAQMCGIRASRTALHTVGERREVLFVKRFDRADLSGKRVPYLSAHTLLGLDIDAMRGDKARSYLVLADRARQIGVPAEDIKEIWRRMAFNALVHNVDDHPRNHGFILNSGRWRLSPAFDIVPFAAPEPQSEVALLALSVDRSGQSFATAGALVSSAEHFGYSPEEAGSALQAMARIVADGWKPSMRAAGLETAFLEDYQARTFLWAETVAGNESLVAAAVQEASAPKRRRRLRPSHTALAPRPRKPI